MKWLRGRSFGVIFGNQRIPCGRVCCVDDEMVFITYLCLDLALIPSVWYYCDIYYTTDGDLSIGPVVLAWLVIPVEDIASVIGQGCFAIASRIHLRLITISLLTTASTIKIILRMPTQYFENFADNAQARLVGN